MENYLFAHKKKKIEMELQDQNIANQQNFKVQIFQVIKKKRIPE